MGLRRDVAKLLGRAGYCRQTPSGYFLLGLGAGYSYWVDIGPLGRQEDVSPFIGIRSDQVEELLEVLLGVPPDPSSATVAGELVCFVPGVPVTWFAPSSADHVVAAICTGTAALAPFVSLDRLRDVTQITGLTHQGWAYKEIVISSLTSDHGTTLALLNAAAARFCKRDDEVCAQFRAFRERTIAYLGRRA